MTTDKNSSRLLPDLGTFFSFRSMANDWVGLLSVSTEQQHAINSTFSSQFLANVLMQVVAERKDMRNQLLLDLLRPSTSWK